MAREKKITAKLVINTDLKSSYREEDGQMVYPVYVQMTYDRKTTSFPMHPYNYIQDGDSENLEMISDVFLPDVFQIAEHEKSRKGKFTVRGFSHIYHKYTHSLDVMIELYGCLLVDDRLQEILTVKEYGKLQKEGKGLEGRRLDNLLELLEEDDLKKASRVVFTHRLFSKINMPPLSARVWLIAEDEDVKKVKAQLSSAESALVEKSVYQMIDDKNFRGLM